MSIRRLLSVLAVCVSLSVLVSVAAPSGTGRASAAALTRRSTRASAAPSEAAGLGSDFNGDGFADVAVGIPYEDLGANNSISNAGAVEVLYGSATGVLSSADSKLWTQDSTSVLDQAEEGDRFGSALAYGDFDGDGYDDLAIGVPYEDITSGSSSISNAGAVEVLFGSKDGLSASRDQFWTQNSGSIEDQAEKGDRFGSALAAGDLHPPIPLPPPFGCPDPGVDDLAVGVPYEDVSTSKTDAGAVNVIFSSTTGLMDCGNEFWTQDGENVPDKAESGDHFGAALAMGHFDPVGVGLAVGVPDEDVGNVADAGAVNVLTAAFEGVDGGEYWNENSDGVADTAEAGDHFGAALATTDFFEAICCPEDPEDDLAIGIPGEDGGATDVGAVHILPGDQINGHGIDSFGEQYFGQDAPEQAGAQFGSALTAGVSGSNADDHFLAIGSPFMDVGSVSDAGAVTLRYWGGGTSATWTQDSTNVLDDAESGDRFGGSLSSAVTSGTYANLLAIGVPRENLGSISNSGAVSVLYATGTGFGSSDNQLWDQDTTGVANEAESGDRFGDALG